jgi:surface polysaccharide O-acyltransferase-like enzyme
MARRLLLLNGLAIVGAVIHHSVYWVLTAMFWWTDQYRPVTIPNFDAVGSVSFFLMRMIDQFAFAAVPAFLLVSGFFVAATSSRQTTSLDWRLPLKRVLYLLIPYLIWSSIILFLRFVEGKTYTVAEVVRLLIFGQAAPPYYYVPLLIQLYLLSPILAWLAKFHWKPLLAVSTVIQIPQFIARYSHYLRIDTTPNVRLFLGIDIG